MPCLVRTKAVIHFKKSLVFQVILSYNNELMFYFKKQNKIKGFTLIELLVVVAIISLLSSIVLATLTSARNRSRDSAIQSEVGQFRTLLELQKNDTNSYATLQKGWVSANISCSIFNNSPVSNYATKAVELCNSIYKKSSVKPSTTSAGHFFTNVTTPPSPVTSYSIMVWLPGVSKWYCAGSSGASGIYTSYVTEGTVTKPGCFQTP